MRKKGLGFFSFSFFLVIPSPHACPRLVGFSVGRRSLSVFRLLFAVLVAESSPARRRINLVVPRACVGSFYPWLMLQAPSAHEPSWRCVGFSDEPG
jgi:hypothetical protein